MKKLLFVLLCVGGQVTMAQTSASFSAKSGDNELDASLSEMNANAKVNLSLFKKNLNLEFGISTGKVDQMLVTMQPADVYMCCEVGHIAAKPVETVVTSYEKNKGKGWGVIAKEMGIKPGSKEFHELKNKAKNKNEKAKKDKSSQGKGNGNGKSHGNGHGKGH
jgi:hypothetical protein